jgi:hypothetical protein
MPFGFPSERAFSFAGIPISSGPLFGGVKTRVREGRPVVDGVYVNGKGLE